MALTQVELPVINNRPAGVAHCYLLHDDSIVDLTYPTSVLFLSLGNTRESIDIGTFETEFDNVDVDVKEDYSTHTEGFWHKLIYGYPDFDFELMFTIDEGADETFRFRGRIYRVNITETEHYQDVILGTPSDIVRGIKFTLVTSLKVLESISIADLCTEILTHMIFVTIPESPGIDWYLVKQKVILATMIQLAYGETYDEDLVIDNATDIQVKGDADVWHSWLDTFIYAGWFAEYVYPDAYGLTTTYYSGYKNAYELLKHLCKQWCIIPGYTFGNTSGCIDATPANNKSRIVLRNRGNSGSLVTMPKHCKPSYFKPDTDRKISSMSTSFIAGLQWFFDSTGLHQTTPETWRQIDNHISVDFAVWYLIAGGLYGLPGAFMYHIAVSNGCYYTIRAVRYWNYSTGAYVVWDKDYTNSDLMNNHSNALIEYVYYRFFKGRCEYERNYNSIKVNDGSTNSQRNCQTLMRHVIHDGVQERTFYATEVEIDIFGNNLKVIWVQEQKV